MEGRMYLPTEEIDAIIKNKRKAREPKGRLTYFSNDVKTVR